MSTIKCDIKAAMTKFNHTVQLCINHANKKDLKHTKHVHKSNWYTITTYKFSKLAKLVITYYNDTNYRPRLRLEKYSPITDVYNWSTEDDIFNKFKRCKHYTPEQAAKIKAKNDAKIWELVKQFGKLSCKSKRINDYTLELHKLGRNSDLSDPTTKIMLKANLWTTDGFIRGVVIDLNKKKILSKTRGELKFDNTDEIIKLMTNMIKSTIENTNE